MRFWIWCVREGGIVDAKEDAYHTPDLLQEVDRHRHVPPIRTKPCDGAVDGGWVPVDAMDQFSPREVCGECFELDP